VGNDAMHAAKQTKHAQSSLFEKGRSLHPFSNEESLPDHTNTHWKFAY